MMPAAKKKPDFLEEVVDDMGNDEGGTDYGADMEEGGGDESSHEDMLMAAGMVAKALGMPNSDNQKLADALKAFIAAC